MARRIPSLQQLAALGWGHPRCSQLPRRSHSHHTLTTLAIHHHRTHSICATWTLLKAQGLQLGGRGRVKPTSALNRKQLSRHTPQKCLTVCLHTPGQAHRCLTGCVRSKKATACWVSCIMHACKETRTANNTARAVLPNNPQRHTPRHRTNRPLEA
jgi:hypothetical protein